MRRLLHLLVFYAIFFACRGGRIAEGVQADLIQAARAGNVPAVRSAIARGADVNAPDQGINGWTPLMHAIHKGQPAAAKALVEAGADPNRSARNGGTPLLMASGYGYAPIVRELLRHGADPRIPNAKGETARDLALTGVTDIDRFTWFSCQNETAALLAGTPAQQSSLRWAKMKRCT
jgi:ankyrin repeat protein